MNSTKRAQPVCRLAAGFLSLMLVAGPSAFSATESLFGGDEIFDVTLQAPLTKLMKADKNAPDVAGHLLLAGGTSVPVTVSKYGISRLRECKLASLQMKVDEADVRGTPFEGLPVLRLVTPCQLQGDYDSYTTLEYLVYQSYAFLTEPALRTRLVRVRFRDSDKPSKDTTGYAFFIEDINHAAERRGQVWMDINSQQIEDLDPEQLVLMTLFQYMIGNTDWSAVKGRPDERCCHNIAVFEGGGALLNAVVPFDFDATGVVDPPYAVPAEGLGLRWVTDRKYRGLCGHNALLPAAIAVFKDKRDGIEALFNREDLPYPKSRQRALKYIGRFFETINSSKEIEKRIVADCR